MLDAKQDERFMRNLLEQGRPLAEIVRRRRERRSGKLSLRSSELDLIFRELNDALKSKLSFVIFHRPLAELWDETEKLCADTNIDPSDSIHVATALAAECDVLVSRDSDLVKIAKPYLPAASPERTGRLLQELGFKAVEQD